MYIGLHKYSLYIYIIHRGASASLPTTTDKQYTIYIYNRPEETMSSLMCYAVSLRKVVCYEFGSDLGSGSFCWQYVNKFLFHGQMLKIWAKLPNTVKHYFAIGLIFHTFRYKVTFVFNDLFWAVWADSLF